MTEDQFKRLPKFAQDEIRKLRRAKDEALKNLSDHLEAQNESPVYYEKHIWTGEKNDQKRFYIQSRSLNFSIGDGIVNIRGNEKELNIWWHQSDFALIPISGNVVRIIELKNAQPHV